MIINLDTFNGGGGGSYVLPTASESTLGGVRIGDGIDIDNRGVISVDTSTLDVPVATESTAGTIIVGDGLEITSGGTLSVDSTSIELPIATSGSTGVVKVGEGINITNDGTISVSGGGGYILPTASDSTLGGVKIGNGVTIDSGGTISVETYTLPTATDSTIGGVKIGNGLTIDSGGTLDVDTTELPTASANDKGVIKVGNGLTIDSGGTLSAVVTEIPTASSQTLGAVKIGSGVSIDSGGTISVESYSLPTATDTVLGGVKVGSGLNVTRDGSISIEHATNDSIGGIIAGQGVNVENGVLKQKLFGVATYYNVLVQSTVGTLLTDSAQILVPQDLSTTVDCLYFQFSGLEDYRRIYVKYYGSNQEGNKWFYYITSANGQSILVEETEIGDGVTIDSTTADFGKLKIYPDKMDEGVMNLEHTDYSRQGGMHLYGVNQSVTVYLNGNKTNYATKMVNYDTVFEDSQLLFSFDFNVDSIKYEIPLLIIEDYDLSGETESNWILYMNRNGQFGAYDTSDRENTDFVFTGETTDLEFYGGNITLFQTEGGKFYVKNFSGIVVKPMSAPSFVENGYVWNAYDVGQNRAYICESGGGYNIDKNVNTLKLHYYGRLPMNKKLIEDPNNELYFSYDGYSFSLYNSSDSLLKNFDLETKTTYTYTGGTNNVVITVLWDANWITIMTDGYDSNGYPFYFEPNMDLFEMPENHSEPIGWLDTNRIVTDLYSMPESLTNGVKFWKGTQADYDAIATAGINYDPNTLYIITGNNV